MSIYLIAIGILIAYAFIVSVILKIKVVPAQDFYDDKEGDFVKRHTCTKWADDL